MFENKQDTTLFLSSLDSASNYLISKKNSNGSNSLDDEEEALKIVVSTINSLTCNLYDVKTISELFEKQLILNRRCHSIAFIALLRSLGITSSEADSHYQSVLHNLPEVKLHFYLKLSSSCHWSEYFIECAHQLEAKVLSAVLKLLLEVKCEGELKYYIWHLTLQSIIWKIFTIQFPYMTDSDKLPPFLFKFSAPELLMDRNEENSTKKNMLGDLSQVYDIILKLLSQQAEQGINNNDYLKVVFHAFKSLFQLVIKMRKCDDPIMERFKDLYPIFAQCLTEESSISTIIKDFSECNKCAIDLFHLMTSWEISDLYLLFLLQNLWRDFNAYFKKNSFNTCYLNDYKKFHSFMIEKNLSWNSLKEIIEEQYVNKSDGAMKKYCCLLKNVVNNHGPCASRALEYFLLHFDLWEEYKIIDLMEKNLSSLDPFLIYEPLISAIINSSSEQKHRLLMCFYSMLTQAPQEIYGLVLDHVINRWGYCDYFKLPDFDSELTQFTRKTMTLEEAEQFLPALFVQSPKETLKSLIEQVLMQGTGAMKILEVLSAFSIVCLYESSESVECPLIDVLSHYFEDDLSAQQAKNLILIIKSLAEIEIAHKKIFPFDLFFEKCISSNLNPCDSSKVEISVECLYVYFEVLMPDNGDKISVNSFAELIKHLGFILIFCIENGYIKLKEKILSIFDQLASSKSKFRLAAALMEPPYNENDVAKLYVLGSFIKKIKDSTYLTHKDQMIGEKCELLWIWCCITNDEKLFSEKIKTFDLSYENLLTILTSLLPHLTKFEWDYSTKLISQYLTLLNIKASDYPWLLPGADLELYGIIRCLMDCFTLIIQEKSSNDYINVSGNFVNIIMSLLNKTTVPKPLLLNVFLDVCHLVSLLNTEMVYMFSSLLLDLKKNITLTYDPENEDDYMTLLELGIESLQKFKEIQSLMS